MHCHKGRHRLALPAIVVKPLPLFFFFRHFLRCFKTYLQDKNIFGPTTRIFIVKIGFRRNVEFYPLISIASRLWFLLLLIFRLYCFSLALLSLIRNLKYDSHYDVLDLVRQGLKKASSEWK